VIRFEYIFEIQIVQFTQFRFDYSRVRAASLIHFLHMRPFRVMAINRSSRNIRQRKGRHQKLKPNVEWLICLDHVSGHTFVEKKQTMNRNDSGGVARGQSISLNW